MKRKIKIELEFANTHFKTEDEFYDALDVGLRSVAYKIRNGIAKDCLYDIDNIEFGYWTYTPDE